YINIELEKVARVIMKIAILSMQKVVNYGSFMQSFALRKTIENLGHECEYIDIEFGVQKDGLKRDKILYLNKFKERFLNIHLIKNFKQHRLLNKRFNEEFFSELGILNRKYSSYDTVVIGSDEVFNFAQPTPWGFTEQLYGNVKEAKNVISYAGSFGHTTMTEIEKYGVKSNITSAMRNMKAISVRDINSVNIVDSLLGIKPQMHVDPVFLYDFNQHMCEVPMKDYIIIYTYPSRISNKDEINRIVKFAKKHNKKLISVGFFFPWCDEVITPHPFEVLSYIKNADYIITDTFHGTIFSLINNKKFGTIIRNTNSQKLSSLLKTMKKSERIIHSIESLDITLTKDITYDDTNKIILQERERSFEYLRNNL
ncbi:polysaccharide pyruvyl transferase family protein, partial [Providencia stuartii]|uniref:polysaccharide pyruvyl transferase family protein n=2 Tax=Providencia stuartii TaxID=588 RepID=UPI003330076E